MDPLVQEPNSLAADERQRMLSRLLARVAHEIRNPLSSLEVHVQLLEEDVARLGLSDAEKTSNRLDIIRGEIQRLDNIVKQFLRLAGPSALELQSMDVAATVEHVCELLHPEAAARGVEIAMEVPADLPAMIADAGQVTQALVNLVLNALQAITGSGRIEVSVTPADAGAALTFRVSDTGPGVDEAKRAAIFEPFFTTKPHGSGLGLWIVQQIAFAHGGSITVENAVPTGAVFTLRLPVRATNPRP